MTEVGQSETPIVADPKTEQENPAKQFENTLRQSVDTANTAEAEANKVAREALLQRAQANTLRDAGIRKVVYGMALTPISMVGSLIGYGIGRKIGESITNTKLGNLVGLGGYFTGAYGGVELSALAYEHIIRRWDTQARGLDKKDWIFGQLISSPTMVSGIRDIWNGHRALSAMNQK